MDISTKLGKHLINYRVSAIIRKGDKILVHHEVTKKHCTLPGGRVSDGETSIQALQREIKEEIGFDTNYIRPIAFIENFFNAKGEIYHELLFTHELEFKDKEVYSEKRYEASEAHKKGILEFLWIDINDNNLEFLPEVMENVIKNKNGDFVHIINEQRNKNKI